MLISRNNTKNMVNGVEFAEFDSIRSAALTLQEQKLQHDRTHLRKKDHVAEIHFEIRLKH